MEAHRRARSTRRTHVQPSSFALDRSVTAARRFFQKMYRPKRAEREAPGRAISGSNRGDVERKPAAENGDLEVETWACAGEVEQSASRAGTGLCPADSSHPVLVRDEAGDLSGYGSVASLLPPWDPIFRRPFPIDVVGEGFDARRGWFMG